MIEVLGAAAGSDAHWTWTLFGRLHPLTVHFPIALLTVAALVEGLGLVRRRAAAGDLSWICVGLGAIGAIASTVMGYAFAASKTSDLETLELHERLGLITTIVTVLTLALAWRARRSGGTGGPAMAFRAFLFVSALGVGVTGHFGGEMVYPDWWRVGPFARPAEPLQVPKPPPENPPIPISQVDFVKDIAPLIKASCLKCHNAEKQKAKLRLDVKALALKGGSGGKAIIPGKPDDSTFYTLLISTDDEERMPEKAPALPKETTDLIKKWIEQGAPWPDDFEIK